MRILNLAMLQNKIPSEVMQLEDEYTAFCFDEACTSIQLQLKKGKEPEFEKKKKRVSSMAEYFKELGV